MRIESFDEKQMKLSPKCDIVYCYRQSQRINSQHIYIHMVTFFMLP